ncbi:hypothetical protein [Hoeflea ulvae]|uniref:Uncharacterized protein n=1 Tax=Hoeflea ulvae TaxID=2983764 RepID=A0ABT3YFE5_9HYPH|nr:hypothetical protein [Hoeflea ulvae]MCY0094603.1 hypothetical protein [Hoeflea ulvae]
MIEPAVVITAMRLVEAECRGNGSRLVATFDADFPTFKLVGCLVIADVNGETHAYTPEARSRTRDARPIVITDPDLRQAMQRKAVRVYEALADEADAA